MLFRFLTRPSGAGFFDCGPSSGLGILDKVGLLLARWLGGHNSRTCPGDIQTGGMVARRRRRRNVNVCHARCLLDAKATVWALCYQACASRFYKAPVHRATQQDTTTQTSKQSQQTKSNTKQNYPNPNCCDVGSFAIHGPSPSLFFGSPFG